MSTSEFGEGQRTEHRSRKAVTRAARWSAPALSLAISSVGNVALILVAARTLSTSDFGVMTLAYGGVLLVSQLIRVALGEASMVQATTATMPIDVASMVLGAALTVTPIAGVVLAAAAMVTSGSPAFAAAVGVAGTVIPLTDTARYALLARGRVGRTVGFDLTWTLSEFIGLVVVGLTMSQSPVLLLAVWSASAATALVSIYGVVRPAPPRVALGAVSNNPHWWRLCANEAIITGSSYAILAVLAIAAGTEAVGALRASLLPYLWVQLAIAATWIVILSLQPARTTLANVVRLAGLGIVVGIALTAVAVKLLPFQVGTWLFEVQWRDVDDLTMYAAVASAALAVAELLVVQLKARAATSSVLAARFAGALTTVGVAVVIVARPLATTALVSIAVCHLVVAMVAYRRLRRSPARV